jgi:predicted RNA-binding Zn-ribbon protein involved in translation (DUF1610 family)
MKKPPCKLPCPKCGSADVNRQHLANGQTEQQPMGGNDHPLNTKHVTSTRYRIRCAVECILHHCRDCGWGWTTAPMKRGKP